MPRRRVRGALAAMLAEAEAEIIAEMRAEEETRRARRAYVARANLAKARERRHGQQPKRSAEDARQCAPLSIS
jgi:hypothetical protein